MKEKSMAIATFGGGCFWGVEELFRTTEGVTETASGYMGGTTNAPTYQDVCTNATNHAEVVHLTYDEDKVSYGDLLALFFENHNPTEMNRQGPDVGTQYRSVIFSHSDEQEAQAKAYIEQLIQSKRFSRPIVTAVLPAEKFWLAEDYHQQYLNKRGLSACHI